MTLNDLMAVGALIFLWHLFRCLAQRLLLKSPEGPQALLLTEVDGIQCGTERRVGNVMPYQVGQCILLDPDDGVYGRITHTALSPSTQERPYDIIVWVETDIRFDLTALRFMPRTTTLHPPPIEEQPEESKEE